MPGYHPPLTEAAMRTNRMLVLAMTVFYLSGCYSWRAQPYVPDQFVAVKQPRRIRVTTAAGEQLVLDRPEVRNDSIVGMGKDGVTGIPVQDIERIETPSSKPDKAVKIGIGLAVAALVVVIVASQPQPKRKPCYVICIDPFN